MPGLAQKNDQSTNATRNDGFWSRHVEDVGHNQLQKFWSEISPQARQDLLKIDKQTLLEQARKNMYCSRCNGLLLEAFMQIVVYGKSPQEEGGGGQLSFNKPGVSKDQINRESNETLACKDGVQDPSVHPWGGLTTTREGLLTLPDCYLYSKSLKGLQNVFDSARAREREREMHYPDACGGGGRGWLSQGMVSYGRGHGTRESCALHTSRLSCDTLVDFWSALGEDTRYNVLRMKEEDFVERLMYRFESKRFCRDCRRNVVREFKELKELKRTRREPRCTSWFCVAETAFQYEVSNNTIHADWNQTFIDSAGKYQHFEWAVGTGEGKSDILGFKNVGMKRSVQAKGLDLGGLTACYIALRAYKPDGHCIEISVKAHALKGEQCVHSRLMVGDGYITISHGESIRRFFEYAEEAEEEEDDNSIDKDGNEVDDDCSRPQKHAKSPELAREFLLDAATVIFKEQVEKAFREGTTRQNAHSIFVCLALKLLEERAHVACKETITLEKQMKLIEEEEKEKHEEEERKERKRTKEKEKKLRRKERLRGKDKVNNCAESNQNSILTDINNEVSSPWITQEVDHCMAEISSEYADPTGTSPASPDIQGVTSGEDENELFTVDDSILSYQDLKLQTEFKVASSRRRADRNLSTVTGSVRYQYDSRYCNGDSECSSQEVNEWYRQSRSSATECTSWEYGPRYNNKSQSMTNRKTVRNELHSCGCDRDNVFKEKVEPHALTTRYNWEKKSPNKMDSNSDLIKPAQRINKLTQNDHVRDNYGRLRSRIPNYGNCFSREPPHIKKVWEPVEPQKRYPRSSSDSDVTLRSYSKVSANSEGADSGDSNLDKSGCSVSLSKDKPFPVEAKALCNSKKAMDERDDPRTTRSCKSSGSPDLCGSSCSSSDNCSCLSEGDSNTSSFTSPIQVFSSTSDSEDGGEVSDGREASVCTQIDISVGYSEVPQVTVQNKETDVAASKIATSDFVPGNLPWTRVTTTSSQECVKGPVSPSVEPVQQEQGQLPQIPNMQSCFPTFQAPPMMGYYHQNQQVAWPTALINGFVVYAHPNPYLCTSPFGYSMSGDSNYCMPYDAVHHLPSPLLNAVQLPVYQPVVHNAALPRFQEQKGPLTNLTGGVGHSNGVCGEEAVVQRGPSPKKKAPASGVCEQKTTDVQTVNTGFSLFKFSGPVPRALSVIKRDTKSLGGDLLKGLPSDLSSTGGVVGGDEAIASKIDTTIEEYTLFAATKGIQFSIF